MGDERPGHPEHARVALKRPARELRQHSIETGREILADLADLLFNEVVVIEQPLGGRRDRPTFPRGRRNSPIGGEQHQLVVAQPRAQRPAGCRSARDLLRGGEASRMLLEALNAEELFAQDLATIPG